jgi:hypothetical protein
MHDFAPGVLALAAAALVPPASAQASTPSRMWKNVRSLGVQCVVGREPFRNDPELQPALCERVARLAGRGAPVPVRVIQLGDPALIAPGAVALLVHASVQPSPPGRQIVFYVRVLGGPSGSADLFGSAPRAVPLDNRGLASPALDAALNAALSEVLPWQARAQGERSIKPQE